MARMPQVSARELVGFLKAEGFVEDRQSGSHLTLRHTMRKVTVTVPVHTGPISDAVWRCASSRTRALPLMSTCSCDEPTQRWP
jgi:predicted RNA binding protein YcfA (HicA-like mRNA interferase family)